MPEQCSFSAVTVSVAASSTSVSVRDSIAFIQNIADLFQPLVFHSTGLPTFSPPPKSLAIPTPMANLSQMPFESPVHVLFPPILATRPAKNPQHYGSILGPVTGPTSKR
jgi:hypothetical protein